MATKITRKTMRQFGGALTSATGAIAIFGSAAAGGTIGYSLDPVQIMSLSQWLQGWTSAVFGNNAPAKQDRNAIDYTYSWQLGYVLQQGMPEVDLNTPYFQWSFCAEAGVIYCCYNAPAGGLTGVDPLTDVTAGSGGKGNYWQTLASMIVPAVDSRSVAKAWAYINGQTGAIIKAYNITGVTVNGTGNYTLQIAAGVLADANYAVVMGTSNDSNAPYDPFTRFNGDVKTATALQVRNLNGNTLAGWGNNAENYVAIYD